MSRFLSPIVLSAARKRLLGAALARSRAFHVEYQGYLSNHLTHNWVVMGITAPVSEVQERVDWWFEVYKEKLEERKERKGSGEAVTDGNWKSRIERTRESYVDFLEYFDAKVAELPRQQVIDEYLPSLLPGLVGAAVHPVIHAGWAVEAGDDGMLAEGLAYMAVAFQPLGAAAEGPEKPWSAEEGLGPLESAVAWLKRAKEERHFERAEEISKTPEIVKYGVGEFQHRVIAFNDDAGLAAELNSALPVRLPALGESLVPAVQELAAIIAAAVLGSHSEFFVIHGLTSYHAVLALASSLSSPEHQRDALGYWMRAAMPLLSVTGVVRLPEVAKRLERWAEEHDKFQGELAEEDGLEDEDGFWAAALEKSQTSEDEHIPKAVFVLWRWSHMRTVHPPHSLALFRETAEDLVRENDSGKVGDNLWINFDFVYPDEEEE